MRLKPRIHANQFFPMCLGRSEGILKQSGPCGEFKTWFIVYSTGSLGWWLLDFCGWTRVKNWCIEVACCDDDEEEESVNTPHCTGTGLYVTSLLGMSPSLHCSFQYTPVCTADCSAVDYCTMGQVS